MLWTLFLQRLLATPTIFDATLQQLPFWEYVVMGLIVIFCISPTLEFCGRLVIVEGWRNLLDADSATSFIDIGWTSCICWCGLPTLLPTPAATTTPILSAHIIAESVSLRETVGVVLLTVGQLRMRSRWTCLESHSTRWKERGSRH